MFAVRKPRNVFIETQHTGTAPIKKTWSYYKRTGSLWEDIDHIPPARLQHFLRPDLGIKAAQAINKRYEQEQALADMRAWSQALNRAKLRATFAERREARERFEESIGLQRPRTAKPDVHGTALAAKMCAAAFCTCPPPRAVQKRVLPLQRTHRTPPHPAHDIRCPRANHGTGVWWHCLIRW